MRKPKVAELPPAARPCRQAMLCSAACRSVLVGLRNGWVELKLSTEYATCDLS